MESELLSHDVFKGSASLHFWRTLGAACAPLELVDLRQQRGIWVLQVVSRGSCCLRLCGVELAFHDGRLPEVSHGVWYDSACKYGTTQGCEKSSCTALLTRHWKS